MRGSNTTTSEDLRLLKGTDTKDGYRLHNVEHVQTFPSAMLHLVLLMSLTGNSGHLTLPYQGAALPIPICVRRPYILFPCVQIMVGDF